MFLDLSHIEPRKIAAETEDGRRLSYRELSAGAEALAGHLPEGSLLFSFCENSFGSLVGYLAAVGGRAAALLLDRKLDPGQARQLVEIYRPAALWLPETLPPPCPGREIYRAEGYRLLATDLRPFPLHPELALLMTTSGSTGSPRLVRQSRRNLAANTRSIVEYLAITAEERPITTLPMNYVYGLSIINSHLSAGATLLLTDRGLMEKEFWRFCREGRATSLAGVPYTYEMLKRLRFGRMDLPDLRTLTQAGGKLLPELHQEVAREAAERGRKFVVMYGAAEATARMGWLPPERALDKIGSMGRAIPGGRFTLEEADGTEITAPGRTGELIYYGENVSLGYAEMGEDLARGDERGGRLATGDLAWRDEDGFYYISGRKKRFLKMFGHRVGLDESERLVKSRFPDLDCACVGRDDLMRIFIAPSGAMGGDDEEAPAADAGAGFEPPSCHLRDGLAEEVRLFLAETTRINLSGFVVRGLAALPKNEAGKTLYADLEKLDE